MGRYLLTRLAAVAAVLLGVLCLTFWLFEWLPGDAAMQYAPPEATPAELAAIRRQMGLDAPAAVRFGRALGRLLQGDLGHSLRSGRPVAAELIERYPATLRLAALTGLLAASLGIPWGVLAAARPKTLPGRLALLLSALLPSLPFFWLGLCLLLLLSVWLPLLPPGGGDSLAALMLPALTLGLTGAALLARYTRAGLVETLGEPYIQAAQARGLPPQRLLFRHALRPASVPVLTAFGIQLGHLLGGSVLVEAIFATGGVGSYLVQAIAFRDLPAVQAAVLLLAAGFALANLGVELLIAWADPRSRQA